MIANEQQSQTTLERVAWFQKQVAHLHKTETNPLNYRAAVSGFLAEMDRLHLAFKPQPDRFLCFFTTGRKITNAFVKKSNNLPPGEKDRALRAKAGFEARVKKGTYYENE